MKEVVIMREYIMKGIKTTINSSDYISNINDVVGIIKDVTLETETIFFSLLKQRKEFL